ncbi:MAG: DUF4304 domain-containing protein [Planctomycetes bacterium]|nr:DUF4304 domain-containing protein [Planctomycetota bacterium]
MPRDQRLDAMLHGLLRVAGFLGRPPTWHRSVPIGLHVVNLQKSQFGNQYYLNFGIYVADLGDLTAPRAHQCHFNARVDVRDRADERLWKHVLDLDRPMEPEARAQSLDALLQRSLIQPLDRLRSLDDMRRAHVEGWLPGGLMAKSLRTSLDAGQVP